ncbi:tRNA-guanosine(34) transglycosylase [Balamuthia mandrillaris]
MRKKTCYHRALDGSGFSGRRGGALPPPWALGGALSPSSRHAHRASSSLSLLLPQRRFKSSYHSSSTTIESNAADALDRRKREIYEDESAEGRPFSLEEVDMRRYPPPPPTSDNPNHYAPASFPSHSSSAYFSFEVLHRSTKSNARVGRIHTPHGVIDTPGFVAVGTNASLKHVSSMQAHESGIQAMFANTYHLLLHPGPEVVAKAGGLHKFMNHRGPIMTDSGGFQVFSMMAPLIAPSANASDPSAFSSSSPSSSSFVENQVQEQREVMEPRYLSKDEHSSSNPTSLQQNRDPEQRKNVSSPEKEKRKKGEHPHRYECMVKKISEEGVVFKSYRDGQMVTLTPESSVQVQKALGADIIIPFDELPPFDCTDTDRLLASLHRTHRWESRSLLAHLKDPRDQAMYCVLHGGLDRGMRSLSINYLTSLPFDGIAIGGSVGRNKSDLHQLLQWMIPTLPDHLPRHLLGIGDLESVADVAPLGIDTFDSAYPTRLGRHGTLFTRKEGKISVLRAGNKDRVDEPIDPGCTCYTCQHYSLGYIYHLYRAHEPVGLMLTTLHNLHFMLNYFKELRQKIYNNEI